MARPRDISDVEADTQALELERDGICILHNVLDGDLLAEWADEYAALVERRRAYPGGLAPRGPGRYYVTLPWTRPFADPRVFANPSILKVINRVFAQEYVIAQLAVDTPVLGSDYQEIHRDHRPLFTEDFQTPLYALAVNFPLCRVDEENGPMQMARGTHRMTKEDALRKIASGEIEMESFPMEFGDVAIRTPYAMHRGTPNRSAAPRPMVVMGYVMHWLHTAKVDIEVPRDLFESLPGETRALLRCKLVDALSEEKVEAYVDFKY
jgi:ectoine hydroxylase-related dioxygenase (phytanoyl-CoA dioxygenase family)